MSGAHETAWICPSCAHFTVRVGEAAATPSHECIVSGAFVELVPYVDSDQALAIRNELGRTPSGPTASRSIS